jgi:hypothetical protein
MFYEIVSTSLNSSVGTVSAMIGATGSVSSGELHHILLMFTCNKNGRFVSSIVINTPPFGESTFYVAKVCGINHPRIAFDVGVSTYVAVHDGQSTTSFAYQNVFNDMHLTSPSDDNTDNFYVFLNSGASGEAQPFSVVEVLYDVALMDIQVTYTGSSPPLAKVITPNNDGTMPAGMSGFQLAYTCLGDQLFIQQSVVSVSLLVPGYDGVNMSWIKQCGGNWEQDLANVALIIITVMSVLCGCGALIMTVKNYCRRRIYGVDDEDEEGFEYLDKYQFKDESLKIIAPKVVPVSDSDVSKVSVQPASGASTGYGLNSDNWISKSEENASELLPLHR